jgi:carbon monoxide dehydrogenase subunit G
MELSERTRVPAPLAEVWPLLSDPASVAGCIPGAQLAPDEGDGVWRGSVRVRFGPTAAVFRGEATLEFDHAAHRCSIEGRGIDGRGASRALSSGTVVATADGDGTLLAVDGSFTVTGPLESFANAGGVHVARALLAEFSANMGELVAGKRGAAPAAAERSAERPALSPSTAESSPSTSATPPSPPRQQAAPPTSPSLPPVARELGAIGLLWRALKLWLRGLIPERKR